jgi:hypothetical protein
MEIIPAGPAHLHLVHSAFLLDAPSRGASSAEGCFPRASAIFAMVSTPTELRAVRRKCIVGREIPDRSGDNQNKRRFQLISRLP